MNPDLLIALCERMMLLPIDRRRVVVRVNKSTSRLYLMGLITDAEREAIRERLLAWVNHRVGKAELKGDADGK